MNGLPYDTGAEFPEHLEPLRIPESYRDVNGHMNIRYHFDLCALAIRRAMECSGLTVEYSTTQRHGFFTAEQHMVFSSEVHIGDLVRATVALIARGRQSVHGVCLLLDESTRTVATTVEFVAIHVSLDSRAAAPWPAGVAERIDTALIDESAVEVLPQCGAMGVRRQSPA